MAKKSKSAKKAVVKKAAPKKVVAKKTVIKKVVKKAPLKKAPLKKAAAKKAVAKRPIEKKTIIKKAVVKKPVVKKVLPKKALSKKVVAGKKATPVKLAPVKAVVKPTPPPRSKVAVKNNAAPVVQLPDATVEKAANINTGNEQMMAPGDGLNEAPVLIKDPVTTFDQNTFNRATAKGDPHSNMHLSSTPKNSIKPSGKKPLWRK